jgi:cold shock CspA family protein
MTATVTGRVLSFDERRGLGEVESADGDRYPFHCTQIADESRTIAVGTSVEFAVTPALLGTWEATHVTPAPT